MLIWCATYNKSCTCLVLNRLVLRYAFKSPEDPVAPGNIGDMTKQLTCQSNCPIQFSLCCLNHHWAFSRDIFYNICKLNMDGLLHGVCKQIMAIIIIETQDGLSRCLKLWSCAREIISKTWNEIPRALLEGHSVYCTKINGYTERKNLNEDISICLLS